MGLKVKFDHPKDSLNLNFTDLGEKSVHAGHLFSVVISPSQVLFKDLKTGVMNLEIREARKNKTLSQAKSEVLKHKSKSFKIL